MFRSAVSPPRAMQDLLGSLSSRVKRAERAASWPGATGRVGVSAPDGPAPFLELITTPGYPTAPASTLTMSLAPGRWIALFRSCTSVAANDGAEVGLIGRATYDSSTTEVVQRGGGDVLPVLDGDAFVLSAAIEILSSTSVDLELLLFWGYYPLVTPLPYLNATFLSASIVAFPG